MGEVGFFCVSVLDVYGGGGGDFFYEVVIIE